MCDLKNNTDIDYLIEKSALIFEEPISRESLDVSKIVDDKYYPSGTFSTGFGVYLPRFYKLKYDVKSEIYSPYISYIESMLNDTILSEKYSDKIGQ